MTISADDLVTEQLWQAIRPPAAHTPPHYGGRPRVDDRAALAGIVHQLRTGVPRRLPTRLACALICLKSLNGPRRSSSR